MTTIVLSDYDRDEAIQREAESPVIARSSARLRCIANALAILHKPMPFATMTAIADENRERAYDRRGK